MVDQMPIEKYRTCAFCDRYTPDSKVCTGCRINHYCSKKCQIEHWPLHKLDCSTDKTNSRIGKNLVKIATKFLEAEEYVKLRKRYPLHTLVIQYFGNHRKPSIEFLEKELYTAFKYVECSCNKPTHLVVETVLRFTPPEISDSFFDYIDLYAWTGKRGLAINSGIGIQYRPKKAK